MAQEKPEIKEEKKEIKPEIKKEENNSGELILALQKRINDLSVEIQALRDERKGKPYVEQASLDSHIATLKAEIAQLREAKKEIKEEKKEEKNGDNGIGQKQSFWAEIFPDLW